MGLNFKFLELLNLVDFIIFENIIFEIVNFIIEELKKEIIDFNLGIYLLELGKIIRDIFVNIDGEKFIWKVIFILVIFDIIEEKLIL